MMGQPSFHLSLAFPNHGPAFVDYLDLEGLPERAREKWKRALLRFLKSVVYRRPGRLVLKSPESTARIRTLLEVFPDARFVLIVRDPYEVYSSLLNMLRAVYAHFGLQRPRYEGLEEFILATLPSMMQRLEEGRRLVGPARFHELRYEELLQGPIGQMRGVYEALQLGDFEAVRPRLEEYLGAQASYQAHHHELTPEVRAEITRRWASLIRPYGYQEKGTPA
jgi:hypothetical protein